MKNWILVFLFLGLTHCTQSVKKEAAETPLSLGLDEVHFSVMTYNVENLFDLEDDPKKDDNTFLPLSLKKSKAHIDNCNSIKVEKWKLQCLNWDWNRDVLKTKLERLAQVIRSGGVDRKGADILIFQEVENIKILSRLNKEFLSDMGYRTLVLIEGRDKRGIDVAFLSRFELATPAKLHDILFPGAERQRVKDTRGILEANFRLPDQSILTAYAVHFPAPFHPASMRVQAFKKLNELVAKLPAQRLYLAAGDFNLTAEEDQKDKVLEKHIKPGWNVAHLMGCKSCPGTNYYAPKDSWSFLDMILLSKSFEMSPWNLREVRLVNELPFQKTKDGTPNDFKLPEIEGVSDHWPLQVIFSQKTSTN